MGHWTLTAALLVALQGGGLGGLQATGEGRSTAPPPSAGEPPAESAPASLADAGPRLDPALLAGMAARAVGPATMSGRVASLAVVPGAPDTIYVGAASGGLWRSRDAGLTWTPLFDDQPDHSIGAIAVDPARPGVIWVGTGEGNPRNSAAGGHGVYRSLDGGETWQHLGLAKSERIHRILLDPRDPAVATVAALGPAWGDGGERGVFRTTDGGESWTRILSTNPSTGCGDLVQDPRNPDKLIASLWDHRREPWFFRSGGPGSGLYITWDAGAHWRKVTAADGLPQGDLGRIGLAIAPSDPDVVYALVEAERNAVLRSDDGGRTWRETSSGDNIGNRPFYFADLRVDPTDADRLYSLWTQISLSEDGGETFEVLVPWEDVHPDHHALWIDPRDPRHLIDGSDGGVAISRDGGENWRYVRNLPLAQFYHVRTDDDLPYHIYGGLQDNGSWRGPSAVWEQGGIRNHHWQEVAFGDGFDTVPDPRDSLQGYAMSQEGFLVRWNLRTGERKSIRPAAPNGAELRFNWNAAIAMHPSEPDTIYFGSQFVHRSRDRGETWETISDDLTTNRPEWQRQRESGGLTVDVTGAENYTTITAIVINAVDPTVLWVGTDDGRLHLSRDAGSTWTSVEERLTGVPAGGWVNHIESSRHDPATAFVAIDDHRRNDPAPYLVVTHDWGTTWRPLATPDVRGHALSVAQDPVDPQLIFLGTDLGLYVTRDGGESWFHWTHGVPTCPVSDLDIHERDGDLVVATHGRGVFIVDDIRPLRFLDPRQLAEPLVLFEPAPAQQHRRGRSASARFPGQGEFVGANRPYGAILTYALNEPALHHPDPEIDRTRERPAVAGDEGERAVGAGVEKREEERVEIVVRDESGHAIRHFHGPAKLGFNRAVWDLRRDGPREPKRAGKEKAEEEDDPPAGAEVLPGRYRLEVHRGDARAECEVVVRGDPRDPVPTSDRRSKLDALARAAELSNRVADAVARIDDLRSDIATVRRKLALRARRRPPGNGLLDEEKALEKLLSEVAKPLEALERKLWTPPEEQGIPAETSALARLQRARWLLGSSWDAPTRAQRAELDRAHRVVNEVLEEVRQTFDGPVARLREAVAAQSIELFPGPLRTAPEGF